MFFILALHRLKKTAAMYQTLLFCHNVFRWLVLVTLLYAIMRAYRGYTSRSAFSKADNRIRHWTATVAHIQLTIGMLLYFQSPVIRYFLSHFRDSLSTIDVYFFGLMHSALMLLSVIVVTIGSAKAKRAHTDRQKFKTMLWWFSIALLIIFIAIPWPFSPFAQRPYFR